MLEAIISAVVAVVSGGAVLTTRLYSRISEIDNRIDKVELLMAKSYVSKEDFERSLERFECHMVRIEDKLDALVRYRLDQT
jgi:hypothetical protein